MTEPQCPVKSVNLAELPMQTEEGRAAGWRTLVEAGPVADVNEAFMATSDSAVQYVLQNYELFSSVHAYDILQSPVPQPPLMFDPPEHVRFRRILAPFFSPGVVSKMYGGLREQVRELIAPLAAAGEADVFGGLAVPFPTQVFLELFGLPLSDRDQLIEWKDRIIKSTDVRGLEGGDAEAGIDLMSYLVTKIQERKGDTSNDDLLTAVVNDTSPEALTDEELLGLSILMIQAGLDTVTQSLMFMFATLAQQPELQARLVADPKLIPDFIEESLRLNPVAPFPPRVVTRDTVVEGVTVPAGSRMTVCLGAANRDPGLHKDPDEIVLGRGERHWAFGGGPHRCLGSHLARAEMRLVLEEWLKLVPSFSLNDDVEPRMVWPTPLLSLEELTLVFPPASV
ncbi:cytochrome P450 [Actinocorallia herbida]|uniref:Cytochrome P450 n=1 Tax=Actinocorallia herbida TaxID=58109 RepID=A0A3N1D399_9ACTN|nr:cytochrome P450 [Actinocorallia herbida]ROO87989.1 cytochrome P450 [Actinocorallia herbida]